MFRPTPRTVGFLCVAVTALGLGASTYYWQAGAGRKHVQRQTIGDVEVIHSKVLVAGHEQTSIGRVAPGDHVITEAAGRARLDLVDGVTALLDVSTDAVVDTGKLELHRGRLFVDSPEGRNIALRAGLLTAQLAASKTAIALDPNERRLSLYCAQGEVMVTVKGQSQRVSSGETLRLVDDKFSIEPEKAFDDWTQGLAVPWQTRKLSRSSLPEVWVYSEQGEPETLLNTRSQSVDVNLDGELSVTTTKTRYFNGNDREVSPKLRVALPPKAQLNRVSYLRQPNDNRGEAKLELCNAELSMKPALVGLEWGGNGWLTGLLPAVPSGGVIELTLEYSEWQDSEAGRMTYRYPFAKGVDAPQIGELGVRIDASAAKSPWLEANRGATRKGDVITWHAADVRPSDDWVTSYVPAVTKPKEARAYVDSVEGKGDPFVMVRLESPARSATPVRVALVLDISASVGLSGLELGRNLVEALLGNLSAKDSAIVIVADEEHHALLGDKPAVVSSQWRAQLERELSRLRPGGASDIGHALEFAADKLDGATDAAKFQNTVIYLGDGKPTLGALGAEQLRGYLMRRTGGMPKLSAVALGRAADVWQMAKLVSGAGEIHTVIERSEAAVIAAKLVSSLQAPSFNDLRLELGPEIDRRYPRDGRTVAAQSTVTAYGRLRGALPKTVKVTYFEAGKSVTQEYPLKKVPLPDGADVARRWAEQRLFELTSSTEGLQPAFLLAKEYGLLTPWSSWAFEERTTSGRVSCTAFERRIVELSTFNDTPYATRIAPLQPIGTGWLEPPTAYDGSQSLEDAVRMNARATVEAVLPAIVGCYSARYGAKQALPGKLEYSIRILPNGKVEQVQVTAGVGEPTDLPLLRCAERVIGKASYLGAERPVTLTGKLELPPPPRVKRSICSTASRLPLELRQGVWQGRSGESIGIYVNALNSCELPTWTDRRRLLECLIDRVKSITDHVALGQSLRARGYVDAATHVERRTLERLGSLEELERARRLFLENEPNVDALLIARLNKAFTDESRLLVVQEGLRLAPHSPLGRRMLLLLLEELRHVPELLAVTDEIRQDPFADAGLLTGAAAALQRLGEERASRRAFAELFERAPFDPWVLAFAGDHLRHAGLHDEAVLAYETLSVRRPDDTVNLVRLGLSQAAAGRVDIATRLLDRAAQIGGRADDERLHELSAYVKAVVLANARDQSKVNAEKEELTRRLAATSLPDVSAIVLIEIGERAEEELDIQVFRGKTVPSESPPLQAIPLGLYGFALEPGVSDLRLVLSRRLITGLARPLPVKVHLLRLGAGLLERTLVTKRVAFDKNAERLEIAFTEELRP